jgi:hypothetical protein
MLLRVMSILILRAEVPEVKDGAVLLGARMIYAQTVMNRVACGGIVVLIVLLTVLAGSCSLFGPMPGQITRWLDPPEPGIIYTYTITTTWHDGSVSVEEREYTVERIEERQSGGFTVKLADPLRLTSLFWIVDEASEAIYESADNLISADDLVILVAPVKQDERFSVTAGTSVAEYLIRDIAWRADTEIGAVRDLVQIEFDYSDNLAVDLTILWSPDVGLVSYLEEHARTSYIRSYERELTGISPPQ